ncbi:hypothetical protein BJ878DRAFT_287573 [Calycina marina]|uniref:AB hydrolase-1 domain-containing protein n=1 Tax=Calycina marina TaxID=1763456 RepID=A0A9P8CKQ0_9HELO|nr:hypothetical protein BJ878DRAFT_287573 [Calycina marina]
MDSSPPLIPARHRNNGRRKSLQERSAHSSSNRIHMQPASPEVISSLITSLSIISSPANQLFEDGGRPPNRGPPSPTNTSFGRSSGTNAYTQSRSFGGSFGKDYGAFDQPSLRDVVDEEQSLDELAASPPVIRTAKPPSGFSALTAPKSPRDSAGLKGFLRGSSRPSSKSSGGSRDQDDTNSIGGLSIEPGVAPVHELRRKSSGDSWGKKQGRNSRGLMYMSSKERLRGRDQERKRSGERSDGSRIGGSDRLVLPQFDSDSFLAGTPIGEEPEESSPRKQSSTESPVYNLVSQGGIGSGIFIPTRDSSLRTSHSAKKRTSGRSTRQSSTQRGGEESGDTIHEVDEQKPERRRERNRRETDSTSSMNGPLKEVEMMHSMRSSSLTQKSDTDVTQHLQVLGDLDEGAPSPSISQRKARASPDRSNRSSSQNRLSTKTLPDQSDTSAKPKGNRSRLKRLSAPLSPRLDEKDHNGRVASPEPVKPPPQIHVDDRPNSADSIDDAVEAYLCSPRLSQKMRHPQNGRTISFSEVGDSEGFAVFCCVGMGLTRYITAFYDELALTLKLRLITPDRPGVGDSEPYNDGTETPLSWPDDVYTICQALKITKFSILAHSAGAIYALATALRMPQHIRGRIHLLAPWIPPSQLNVSGAQSVSPPTNSIPTSQRILRALPTPILKAANSSFMSATSSSLTSSLPKTKRSKRKSTNRDTPVPTRSSMSPGMDKENHGRNSTIYPDPSEPGALELAAKDPSDPHHEAAILAAAASNLADKERQVTYDTRLTNAIWDLATSGANPAVDLLVCLERRHTIGFRYVDITRPVVIHHGSKDTRVPVDNVRWLGKTMKRCEVRVLEGEGHGLMASAAVMGGVLMEIAREWEEWTKVTGASVGKAENGRRTLKERASMSGLR